MSKMKTVPALCAGFLMSATMAFASTETLQNPPPSEFVDAESSVNVPIPTDEGRHIKLTLAFEPTPSNAVQVAFGQDLNGSETLEPEETELIVGCDCGAWFADDGRVRTPGAPQSPDNANSFVQDCGGPGVSALPTNVVTCVFDLKQSKLVADRWTLARVTTHNLADTNLTVPAEFYAKGNLLILR